jgi:hypothetical protein
MLLEGIYLLGDKVFVDICVHSSEIDIFAQNKSRLRDFMSLFAGPPSMRNR